MTASSGRSRYRAIAVLILTLCAVLPYVRALDGGFVWTDHHFVEGNPALQRWETVPRLFTTDAWQVGQDQRGIGYYRPVRNLTFLLDTKLFGPRPVGYHVTNVLVHLACTLLAFGLVGRVFNHAQLAFLSALLFAVHPVHVEAVAWITGRTDSTATLGYLAALYCWMRAHDGTWRPGWWLLGVLAAAWGLLCKESTVTLPATLALCFWFRDAPGDRQFTRLASRCVPAAMLALVYLFVRSAVLTEFTNHPLWGGTLASNMLTGLSLLTTYARLLVVGGPLIAIYEEHIQTSLTHPTVLAGTALVLAAVGAFLWQRRVPRLAFGATWVLVTLSPVLQIIPFKVLLAERFLYLPSVGACVLLAAGLTGLTHLRPLAGFAAAAALAGWYATATVRHVPVWANDFALFEDSLRKAPRASEAVMALARAHLDAGQARQARDLYKRATQHTPEYHLAWYNLGLAEQSDGNTQEAAAAFARATELNPGYAQAWWALGRASFDLGRFDAAARAFAVLVQQNPNPNYVLWWARALARAERWADAATVFGTAIGRGMVDPLLLAEAGYTFHHLDKTDEANALFHRAYDLSPEIASELARAASDNLAIGDAGSAAYYTGVLAAMPRTEERTVLPLFHGLARRAPDQALGLIPLLTDRFPDSVPIHASLIAVLLERERATEAVEIARTFVARHPVAVAFAAYARAAHAAGQEADAAHAASQAVALEPENAGWRLLLGEIALSRHEYETAVAHLERAWADLRGNTAVARALAQAYAETGKTAEAAEVAQAGLRLAPNDPLLLALSETFAQTEPTGERSAPQN